VPKFSTILLDPPWPERGAGKIKRGADRHYLLINSKNEKYHEYTNPNPNPNPNTSPTKNTNPNTKT
jgi:hypothetical protein